MYNLTTIKEAAEDLRYLLNRGYNRKSIIKLVGNRWNLNRDERHILYRTVFSLDEIRARKWNEVTVAELHDKVIAIDTYNILITLESCLKGLLVLQGDDDYLRDISMVFNKYKQSHYTTRVIKMILTKLKTYTPKKILFFLDQAISHSGELSAFLRGELKKMGLEGDASTVPSADKSVVRNGEIIISNDRVVLENSIGHLNLVRLLIEDSSFPKINLLRIN